MAELLWQRIFDELDQLVLIDPHTHINPHSPASQNLGDILGYHYYTELAHSAGMPKSEIEPPTANSGEKTPAEMQILAKEKVGALVRGMGHIDNTVQFSWFLQTLNDLFDIQVDRMDESNWEQIYDTAQAKLEQTDWEQQVLDRSKLSAVFLTNDFDDLLEGFDTSRYIPCLRTDELVFHFAKPAVQKRLEACSGVGIQTLTDFKQALEQRFTHFVSHQARACAISLPPSFTPVPITEAHAATALDEILKQGEDASSDARETLGYWVFWQLAASCRQFSLPFDLMIGVNRAVYPAGVFQGQDLYDSRVSLIQYRELFNAFSDVMFPVSVLASVTNQELVSYAWIFPNVICHGHWWYSNTPSFITGDLQARLEAVPRNKVIGYYSDMYKLEFALPKFAMFKRCLAKVLAEHFVISMGWTEQRAIELGRQILRGNVETVFKF